MIKAIDIQQGSMQVEQTVVTTSRTATAAEEKKQLVLIPKGVTIQDVVNALNTVGVTPRDLITILQTIKAAGALQIETVEDSAMSSLIAREEE